MNRIVEISVVATILVVGIVAAVRWPDRARRSRGPTATDSAVVPVASTYGVKRLTLPRELPGPPKGTAGHDTYFNAVVAGERRALAAVQVAIAASRNPQGGPDSGRVKELVILERAYQERLARHTRELGDDSNH